MTIKPVFSRFSLELDHWQWGLKPDDFKKVNEGYACGRCLEEWEMWRPTCPVCLEPTPLPKIMDAPAEWTDRRH